MIRGSVVGGRRAPVLGCNLWWKRRLQVDAVSRCVERDGVGRRWTSNDNDNARGFPAADARRARRPRGTRIRIETMWQDDAGDESSAKLDRYIRARLNGVHAVVGEDDGNQLEEGEESILGNRADNSDSSTQAPLLDGHFELMFLGTGSKSASSSRGHSCTLLKLRSSIFVFDVGEGACRQWMFVSGQGGALGTGRVEKIFITHLHGDHLFGLPAFLLFLDWSCGEAVRQGHHGRQGSPVEVYGPPGLYNYLAMSLRLSCAKLRHLQVVVHELWGGQEERGPDRPSSGSAAGHAASNDTVFLATFPQFQTPRLQRRVMDRNPRTDTWDIGVRDDDASPVSHKRGYRIQAAEIFHVRGVQTFGYTVEEEALPCTIDANKAKALGVAPGPKYRHLKMGRPVPSDDDATRWVAPEDVCVGRRPRPRKVALLGDNFRASRAMHELCRGADVLIHEATLRPGEKRKGGHASAAVAGRLARGVGAKLLLLHHLSARWDTPDKINEVVQQARDAAAAAASNDSTTTTSVSTNADHTQMPLVEATFDFMQVSVPRGGFPPWESDDVE